MPHPDATIKELFEDADDAQLIEAIVDTVSQIKAGPRAKVLREEHHYAWLVWETSGRISNGGYRCFFESHELEFERRIEALLAIGAEEAAWHLRKAAGVFPRGKPHEDVDQRLAFLERLDSDVFERADQGHELLYHSAILPILSDYIRSRKVAFLKLPQVPTPSFFSRPPRTTQPGGNASSLEVARWILGLGGTCTFKMADGNTQYVFQIEKLPQSPLPLSGLTLSSDRRDVDGSLIILSQWKLREGVESISLENCRVSEAGLQALRSFPSLRYLCLKGALIDDSALAFVGSLVKLERLDLSCTRVTEPGLKALAPLSSLAVLDVIKINIEGDGLKVLRSLKDLRLGRARIKDCELSFMKEMADLERLEVYRAKLSSDSIRQVALSNQLKSLQLTDTGLSEMDLVGLKSHARLESLYLEGLPLSERGARILLEMPRLQRLQIGDGRIDAGARELLLKSRPALELI